MSRWALLSLLWACKSPERAAPVSIAGDAAAPALQPLPPLTTVPTTLESTWVPSVPVAPRGPNPGYPDALATYLTRGFGDRTVAAAWPVQTLGAPKHPKSTPTRLARFVHLTDMHVTDDGSPSRMTSYDQASTITAALRPQETYGCALLNAAARTVRALGAQFVLLGGDAIDNAQSNELDWVLSILDGAPRVECNQQAPFAAAGLGVPYLWVTGNHDVLVQGNFAVDAAQRAATAGTAAPGGTRNHAKPGAPPETGSFVVEDASRALLSRETLLERVRAHGPTAHTTYAWDVPGSPVRLVVLDTTHPSGGAGGVLTRRDADALVEPLLDAALAERRLVILAAHHSSQALTRDGGAFGHAEPDALLEGDLVALLAKYPNVIASLVGHAHRHRVRLVRAGAHAYWEITTAALIDYPNQFRLVELFDEGNGWLTLHATAVDVTVDGDAAGAEALRRAQVDFTAGWAPDGRGAAAERNVILWVKKPSV